MRLPSEQLASHLARDLKPLYTVFGNEPLLALEASDRIRAKARAEGYTEREVLTVDSGFKWNQLALAGNSQSLFASRKLLELRIPTGKPGKEGGEALQNYSQSLPPDTITLIQVSELDWRGQKAAWFEALERAGVGVEAKAVLRRALPQWIAGRLKDQQQDADAATLEFIADRVEGNLMAAHQEVQKLALLFPVGPITLIRSMPRCSTSRVTTYSTSAKSCLKAIRYASPAYSTACRAKARQPPLCCGPSPKKSAPSAKSSPASTPENRPR